MTIKTKRELRKYYNESFIDNDFRFPFEDYPIFLKLLKAKKRKKLLDVACGKGFFLREAERVTEAYGIDLSDVAVEFAEKNTKNSKIIQGDGEKLPFETGFFDYVTSLGSLEHFLNKEKCIKEMLRVLHDDGKIMIIVPNAYYLGTICKVLTTGYGYKQEQEFIHMQTINDWKDLFNENGLLIREIIKYNGFDHIAWFFRRRNPDKIGLYEKIMRRIVNVVVKPLIPLNLSFCFVFICTKNEKRS